MKNLIKLSSYLILTTILFSSCTKTPDACIEILANPISYTGDTISFKSCSMDGNSYLWEFGDGISSTEINPKHVFIIPSDYSVKLTVTSSNGKKSSTDSKSIKINIPTKMVINKIVLTKFPEQFINPNIFMILSFDSNIVSANNQIYNNCQQGVEYTFDNGFPYEIHGESGGFGTIQIEFRDFRGPSDYPLIGSQGFYLKSLYYSNLGDSRNFVGITNSTGIEFEVYFEMEN